MNETERTAIAAPRPYPDLLLSNGRVVVHTFASNGISFLPTPTPGHPEFSDVEFDEYCAAMHRLYFAQADVPVKLKRLVAWIETHDSRVLAYSQDTITATVRLSDASGKWHDLAETFPATYEAARDWLGY
jgi:hypothetical protein